MWLDAGDAGFNLKQVRGDPEKVAPTYPSFAGPSPLHRIAASVAISAPQRPRRLKSTTAA